MPILRLDKISLAFGHLPLLAQADFQIDAGERVCLIGRNGAGKTTLLRVIMGATVPDDGDVWRRETLRVAHLEQEVPRDTDQTIFEMVAGGMGKLGRQLREYQQLTTQELDVNSMRQLSRLQIDIEGRGGWNLQQKVATVLTRLGLPEDKRLADCSGGTRRQVMLARALVDDPDLCCSMSRRIISTSTPSHGWNIICSITAAR